MPRKRHSNSVSDPGFVGGPLTIFLRDGTILKAEAAIPTGAGIELRDRDNNNVAVLDAYQLDVVLQGEGSLAKIGERNRIASSLLKVEHVVKDWERFRLSKPEYAYRLPYIDSMIIFGSGSLNLMLMPDRVSHDLDLMVDERAWMHLHDQINRISSGTPKMEVALHTDNLLRHTPGWRERAALLIGAGGLQFHVVHPLDTLSQKLLREDAGVFAEKDQKDIDGVLTTLNPNEDTLLRILREGYLRFFDPVTAEPARRNTEWFLKQYLPHVGLEKDLVEVAVRHVRELLRTQDLAGQARRKKANAWGKILNPDELLER